MNHNLETFLCFAIIALMFGSTASASEARECCKNQGIRVEQDDQALWLSPSEVAYYPLEDGMALDLSGNENHGSVIGGVTSSTDRHGNVGGALSFNGIDGYVLTNTHDLLDNAQQGTFSVWVKPDSASTSPTGSVVILSYSTIQSSNSLGSFAIDQGNFIFSYKYQTGNTPVLRATAPVAADVWTHLAVVADGVTPTRIYINGDLATTTFDPQGTGANGTEWFGDFTDINTYDHFFSIGALRRLQPALSTLFQGGIDDVRFYDDVLSDEEIQALVEFNPLSSNMVVFGTNSIWLKQNSDIISGHVIANTSSPGPVLTANSELTVGINATTAAGYQLYSEDLKVKQGAVIGGDVFSDAISGNGTINGTVSNLNSLPVLEQLPAFQQGQPGLLDITVDKNDSLILNAGNYKEITVKAGGKLILSGGAYHLNSIDIRANAQLRFEAASQVYITEKFNSNSDCIIGPANGAAINGSDIVIYVNDQNGADGGLAATPKAAKVGTNNLLTANFYVPNGTLWLKQGTFARGAFLASDVIVGVNVQVSLDSFLGGSGPSVAPTRKQGILDNLEFNDDTSKAFSFEGNFPNPFNPQTTIKFALPEAAIVRLAVYDILGREVKVLVNGQLSVGSHAIQFDASNLPSGSYLYRLETPFGSITRQMLLVK